MQALIHPQDRVRLLAPGLSVGNLSSEHGKREGVALAALPAGGGDASPRICKDPAGTLMLKNTDTLPRQGLIFGALSSIGYLVPTTSESKFRAMLSE